MAASYTEGIRAIRGGKGRPQALISVVRVEAQRTRAPGWPGLGGPGRHGRRGVAVVALALLTMIGCSDGGEDRDATGPPAESSTTSAPVTTTTGSVTTTTVVLSCEMVAFLPNSEDAASEIRASGLPCAEAEAFVRIAGRRTSTGGPAQLDVEGYHCVRTRTEEDPLPVAYYECTNGAKRVTFLRS